jgi:uncharacterized protein with von Willebrand factor type A (vWA) domain
MQVTRFPERAGGPAERLAGFMAHLRMNGIPAGLGETETALAALGAVDAGRIGEVRSALRAVCAGDADQERRFDELFDAYWLNRGRKRDGTSATHSSRNMKAKAAATTGWRPAPATTRAMRTRRMTAMRGRRVGRVPGGSSPRRSRPSKRPICAS